MSNGYWECPRCTEKNNSADEICPHCGEIRYEDKSQ